MENIGARDSLILGRVHAKIATLIFADIVRSKIRCNPCIWLIYKFSSRKSCSQSLPTFVVIDRVIVVL